MIDSHLNMNLSDTVSTKAHVVVYNRDQVGGATETEMNDKKCLDFLEWVHRIGGGKNHEQLPGPIRWIPLIFSRTKNHVNPYLWVWGFHGCNIFSYMDTKIS